jgi:hypothetical protein
VIRIEAEKPMQPHLNVRGGVRNDQRWRASRRSMMVSMASRMMPRCCPATPRSLCSIGATDSASQRSAPRSSAT